jgi:hypothetical protein
MKKLFLVTLLFIVAVDLTAQDYPRGSVDLSRITDDLVSYQDQNINYEDLYENYAQLYSNPINLNSATADELRLLNLLTESQISQFLEYRNVHGNLLSVYELQAVPGFDSAVINKIVPFVMIKDPKARLDHNILARIASGKNTYIMTRYERSLQKNAGFASSQSDRFQGSPDKIYTRFRSSNPGDFSFGITTEKDPGEKIIWNAGQRQFGMDYVSWHLQLANKNKIKNLIVGDFQYQFAQGLLLGNAFGLGKGGETITTARKSNVGFLPYTSINEAGYMRGAATTIETIANLYLSAFYSNTKRDANIQDGEIPTFSSLNVSGLHRNENEMALRKKIGEQNYGAIVNYKTSTLDAGLIFNIIDFTIPVVKSPSAYNQFAFQGRSNTNAGAFINYTIRNITFFSEAGKSVGAGSGIVAGALLSLDAKLDMAFVFRNYQKDFHPFYSNAFSESTTPQDESGAYWGWKYRFSKKYNLCGYTDLFRFPWLKFRSYKPSNGNEFLFRFNYQPSKKIIVFVQFRQESKARNTGDNSAIYQTAMGTKRNFALNCDYELNNFLRMKTRAQFSNFNFNHAASAGMTIMQDIIVSTGKFQFTARHALFDTQNFDNRQYAYENDVWLAFSLPMYNGKGIRDYIMAEYKFNKHLSIWLRYSRIGYPGTDAIGDGTQKINGNHRDDLKMQLMVRL